MKRLPCPVNYTIPPVLFGTGIVFGERRLERGGFKVVRRPKLIPSNLLVVEDDPLFFDCLKTALEDEPIHIEWAMNGEEAIRKLHGGRVFPAIVVDRNLPDGKGDELAVRIKKQFPHQQIIFTTGDFQTETLTDLLKSGIAVGLSPRGSAASGRSRSRSSGRFSTTRSKTV